MTALNVLIVLACVVLAIVALRVLIPLLLAFLLFLAAGVLTVIGKIGDLRARR